MRFSLHDVCMLVLVNSLVIGRKNVLIIGVLMVMSSMIVQLQDVVGEERQRHLFEIEGQQG